MDEQTAAREAAGPTTPDLSRLPQVDALLRRDEAAGAIRTFGRGPVTDALRAAVDDARAAARETGQPIPSPAALVAAAADALARTRDRRLHRVVNATGVVLHTNLGRAPLSAEARAAVMAACGYTNLEFDLDSGRRGSRTRHVGDLAAEACGAPAATVVNNNAAALLLVLAALSSGRETIVSRGELIEIGGSFRLPEIMAASGAVMREVGTTNRTRVADYRAATGDGTGLLLKVHPSNYRVVGFAETAAADELAALARETGIPFAYDVGSGLLHPADDGPLSAEPSVAGALAAGADLVLFSGDKLLGGPQAGIIAGRRDLVDACAQHPLARAFRIDKLQRAALEATLEAHLRQPVPTDLPTWAMLTTDTGTLEERARRLADRVGAGAVATPTRAVVGGGSVPGTELDSWGLALPTDTPDDLAERLRTGRPAVVGRVEDGRVVLDLRTVPPAQDTQLARLVRAARAPR